MLPNVDRPAIITALPTLHGRTWVLDLGANVDCTAGHLFQFAVMGSELVSAVEGVEAPTVGLLNIGQEEIKGNEQVKKAHELLGSSQLNYLGYVEGDDIYLRSGLDIVVTDGFVGNVALKASEGVARMVRDHLKRGFGANWLTRLSALPALPVLRGLRRRFDPRRYNGACLLGLRGVVVKSHGSADVLSFGNAIGIAKEEFLADVAKRIESGVALHLTRQDNV
jgi:glycerol-3-phosphate acyltransferase PlsX